MMKKSHDNETTDILRRYAKRSAVNQQRHDISRLEVMLGAQELQRVILQTILTEFPSRKIDSISLIDVGCGTGGNLLDCIRFGFNPNFLVGIELIKERAISAKEKLPLKVKIVEGDAVSANIELQSVDIVLFSVVFSSILSDEFQEQLAGTIWKWIKPGGGVLLYDFVYDNPNNVDVRGVNFARVRALFPDAEIKMRRLTLAPPISRFICRFFPLAYHILNSIPFLRTHMLCWIKKKA